MRKKIRNWQAKFNPIGLVPKKGSNINFRSSKKKRKITLRQIFKFAVYIIAAFFVFAVLSFVFYSKDLPNPNKISDRKIAQSTKIYDRDWKLLYEFHGEENRTVIKSNEISKYVKEATVAIEDKHFYEHPGIDVGGVMKAIGRKFLGKKSRLGGGSTITQQYIKNALLTDERRVSRKIKELILSLEIEQIYSKDEILTGYLNQIPYGNNAYGIEAASKTYFDKKASELTLSEAATLAAFPQAPSYYNANTDVLIGRKNHVLDRMVEEKMITQKEASAAKKQPPTEKNLNFAAKTNDILAPHFVFYVRDQLIEYLGGDQEAEIKLSTTGFKVRTTLDRRMQKAAESAIAQYKNKLSSAGASNAALTAVDPKTGEILAMVGSVDFNNKEFGSVNVTTSPRQPGSSFKPIVYATGFKDKYNPSTLLWDVQSRLDANRDQPWPKNYDGSFSGPLTIRQALQWSLNVPAVKMLQLVGVENTLETAKNMGITTLNRKPEDYGLSLVLGSGEVKLVDLVGAYATFANSGKHMPVTPIMEIQDASGKSIKNFEKKEGEQVLDPQVAYLMNHVLSDDNTRSARWGKTALRVNNRHQVAAKTGTTSSYKDAWTIGYTTQVAAGVWVGNNDAKAMHYGADSLSTAAPIWNAFMREALDGGNWPDEVFPRSKGIAEIQVDKMSNKLPSDQTPADTVVTDVFASWQVPKEKDDVHVKVQIDKLTGKLANQFTPASFIEDKYFTVIHSELPDKPNWEGPVRAWAEQHGLTDLPPTEYDDTHVESSKPIPEFTSLKNNDVVAGTFKITSRVSGPVQTFGVEYFIDGNSIGSATDAPYEFSYDSNKLTEGKHTLKVVATNNIGMTGEASITVEANNDIIPPGTVSSVGAHAGVGSVALDWKNPSDNDLDHIKIYVSTEAGKLGSLYSTTVYATPGSNASTTISGIGSGLTYYFTLHPVDKKNNENQSLTQYSATTS